MKTNFRKASLEQIDQLKEQLQGRHYELPNGEYLSVQKFNALAAGEDVQLTAREAVGIAQAFGWTVGQLLGEERFFHNN